MERPLRGGIGQRVQQAGGEPVGLGVLVARVGLGQILNLIKPTRIDLGVRMSSDLVEGVILNREESQQDPKDGATGRAWPWRRDGGGRDFLGGLLCSWGSWELSVRSPREQPYPSLRRGESETGSGRYPQQLLKTSRLRYQFFTGKLRLSADPLGSEAISCGWPR